MLKLFLMNILVIVDLTKFLDAFFFISLALNLAMWGEGFLFLFEYLQLR